MYISVPERAVSYRASANIFPDMASETFSRVVRLVGDEGLDRLGSCRVILFGVGGVGSWTAEALVRSGICHLTIVDPDVVAPSNINRQLQALHSTVGLSKADVLAARLADINPLASVKVSKEFFTGSTAAQWNFEDYDYVIDAIDSVSDKALLINMATRSSATLFSSMGAALKLDATKIQIAPFDKVTGCRLAAALRRRFKREQVWPRRKFKCVFSPELLHNLGEIPTEDTAMSFNKVAYNGAMAHITAIFGFTLASLVINHALTR